MHAPDRTRTVCPGLVDLLNVAGTQSLTQVMFTVESGERPPGIGHWRRVGQIKACQSGFRELHVFAHSSPAWRAAAAYRANCVALKRVPLA